MTTPFLNNDSREGLCVARQPILTTTGQVFGYELLYRTGVEAGTSDEEKDLAAARVLSDAVLAVGLETLTGGRRAFMNMSRGHVLGNVASLLRGKRIRRVVIAAPLQK